VSLPMPLLTRHSAHQEPTPPTPKMMTRFCMRRSISVWPMSNSVRWKIPWLVICFSSTLL